MTGISSRAMKGNVTKVVARIKPGVAKMILNPCSRSHGSEISLQAEEQHEYQSRHYGRHGKGQIDQRQ